MRKTFFIILLLFVALSDSMAGYFEMHDLEYCLGFYLDSLVFPNAESLMVNKADSMQYVETGERFHCFPSIRWRGYFPNYTCATFYYLWTCSDVEGPEDPHKLIFHNYCNNSIYRYRGSIDDFNSVFGGYLAANCDSEDVLGLIYLYLVSQHIFGPTRILWTPDSFASIVDSFYMNFGEEEDSDISEELSQLAPEYYVVPDDTIRVELSRKQDSDFEENLRREKEIVLQSIEPLKYERTNEYWKIDFYTYSGDINSVEHWIFTVRRGSLEIEKKEPIFEKLFGWHPRY